MKENKVIIFVLFLLIINFKCSNIEDYNLRLTKSLPIEGLQDIQPSGLTIWDQNLYTVSDKHDSIIFKINILENIAFLIPHLTFRLPESTKTEKCDFEGITCDDAGNFYLISETYFQILYVSADGNDVRWITPNLRPYGVEEGLFQVNNAYLEGITYLKYNKFILCAERQPRGIIQVDLNTKPVKIQVFRDKEVKYKLPKNRPADFTGLYWYKNALYILERNAYLISKLIVDENGYKIITSWSYEQIETSRKLRYANMQFGKAEGLSMDVNHIYLVLDNNNEYRYLNPHDNRPLLLILEYPTKF